jgi:hypothetical protein
LGVVGDHKRMVAGTIGAPVVVKVESRDTELSVSLE